MRDTYVHEIILRYVGVNAVFFAHCFIRILVNILVRSLDEFCTQSPPNPYMLTFRSNKNTKDKHQCIESKELVLKRLTSDNFECLTVMSP